MGTSSLKSNLHIVALSLVLFYSSSSYAIEKPACTPSLWRKFLPSWTGKSPVLVPETPTPAKAPASPLGGEQATLSIDENHISTGDPRLDKVVNTPAFQSIIHSAAHVLDAAAKRDPEPRELREIKTVGRVGDRFIASRSSGLLLVRNRVLIGRDYEVIKLRGEEYLSSRVIGEHNIILTQTKDIESGKVVQHVNIVKNGESDSHIFDSENGVQNFELRENEGTVLTAGRHALFFTHHQVKDQAAPTVVFRSYSFQGKPISDMKYESVNSIPFFKITQGEGTGATEFFFHQDLLKATENFHTRLILSDPSKHEILSRPPKQILVVQASEAEGRSHFLLMTESEKQVGIIHETLSQPYVPGMVTESKRGSNFTLYDVRGTKEGHKKILVFEGKKGPVGHLALSGVEVLSASNPNLILMERLSEDGKTTLKIRILPKNTTPYPGSESLVAFGTEGRNARIVDAPSGFPRGEEIIYTEFEAQPESGPAIKMLWMTNIATGKSANLHTVVEHRKVLVGDKLVQAFITQNTETKTHQIIFYSDKFGSFDIPTYEAEKSQPSGTSTRARDLPVEFVPGSLKLTAPKEKAALILSGELSNDPTKRATVIFDLNEGKGFVGHLLKDVYEPTIENADPQEQVLVSRLMARTNSGMEPQSELTVLGKKGIRKFSVPGEIDKIVYSPDYIYTHGRKTALAQTVPVEGRWNRKESDIGNYVFLNKNPKPLYSDPAHSFEVFGTEGIGDFPPQLSLIEKSGKVTPIKISLGAANDEAIASKILDVKREGSFLFITTGGTGVSEKTHLYDLNKQTVELSVSNYQGFRDIDGYRFYVGHPSSEETATLHVYENNTHKPIRNFNFGQVEIDLSRPDGIKKDVKEGQIRFKTTNGSDRIFDSKTNNFLGFLPAEVTGHFDKLNKELGSLLNSDFFFARSEPVLGRNEALESLQIAHPLNKRLRSGNGSKYVVMKGDSGSGRTVFLRDYLSRFMGGEGQVGANMKPVFFELDPSMVSAGAIYRGMAQEKWIELRRVSEKLAHQGYHLVLVIDNVDRIKIESGQQHDQETDTFTQLADLKDKAKIDILVTASPDGWDRISREAGHFASEFQEVLLPAMATEKTVDTISEYLKTRYPNRELIEPSLLQYAVGSVARLNGQRVLPGTAFEVVKDAALDVLMKGGCEGNCKITRELINKKLAGRSGLPERLIDGRPEVVKAFERDLKAAMRAQVTSQDHAIDTFAEALSTFALGINQKNIPIMSYLELGPTGVGKTLTVKALVKFVFGNEKPFLKISGADYQYPISGDRLLELQQVIVDHIRKYPFNVVLFDEIEKLDPKVTLLLLSLLDGEVVDVHGNKINSGMSMVFGTSNLGMKTILTENARRELNGEPSLTLQQRNGLHFAAVEKHFQPEQIRRFDGMVYFNPLAESDSQSIIRIYLEEHVTPALLQKNIKVEFDSSVLDSLARSFVAGDYGARGTTKDLKNNFIDKFITRKILDGSLASGGHYKLSGEFKGLGVAPELSITQFSSPVGETK